MAIQDIDRAVRVFAGIILGKTAVSMAEKEGISSPRVAEIFARVKRDGFRFMFESEMISRDLLMQCYSPNDFRKLSVKDRKQIEMGMRLFFAEKCEVEQSKIDAAFVL